MAYSVSSKSFTAVAINTAARAGEWVRSKQGAFTSLDTKSSSHDLVTEVDKGAETMIRNLLKTYFPDHAILGEEGVAPGPEGVREALAELRDEEYMWIVDPIDGTQNFVHGFPFYCVSIALAHKGELIVGVIYNPSNNEMFVAEKGKGAYVGGKKMSVSKETRLHDSLLAAGMPADRQVREINVKGISALAPVVRNIRTTGSAALHLAYVAAGRVSGFWEVGLSPWDLAAGALLVQESGGQVTDTMGRKYELTMGNIIATNGNIHAELQQMLQQASATG